MRLDQFLRFSRLVKRRPLARSMVEEGAIRIEGKVSNKASCQVEVGDVMQVRFGNRVLKIRVLAEATRHLPARDASALFEVLEESILPAEEEGTRGGEEPGGGEGAARPVSGGPRNFLERS